MAKNLTRKRSILVGLEPVGMYGAALTGGETLDLGKAVQMSDYSPTPLEAATVERSQFRDFVGAAAELTASRTAILNPTCELVGGGLNTVEANNKEPLRPQFYRLLLACGMTEQAVKLDGTDADPTTANETRGWKYTVGDPTKARSVAIRSRVDNIVQEITGCRGTFVITAELGAIPTIAFTMTGRYSQPKDGAITATGNRPTDVPPSLVGSENSRVTGAWPALMPGGEAPAPCVSSVSVDCGHTVTVRDCISDDTGCADLNDDGTGKSKPVVTITDRTTTGSITADADLSAESPWNVAGTGQARAVAAGTATANSRTCPTGILSHGVKPGEAWSFGGNVTVGAITEEDRDGILAYNMPLRFVPVKGNDEFSIIFWGDLSS